MMITLVVIYVLTVTPGRVVDTLWIFWIVRYEYQYMTVVRGAIDLLRAMNSCTNVVVYAVISRSVLKLFSSLLEVSSVPVQ